MKLPRHAEIWLSSYVRDRLKRPSLPAPKRIWVSVMDHYEPFWRNTDESIARQRVELWQKCWPEIAARHPDSAGRPARYSFFYPEEEYRPHLMDLLAGLNRQGLGDVEIHMHHDHDTRQGFVDRMHSFLGSLHDRHGLLHKENGQIRFAFIHGNWALDNSRPDGKHCGLNDEITLLKQLGCYADYTMPSGDSPTQASLVNTIYWATDNPTKPKSYDTGIPLTPGGGIDGDLLMIPGPMGLRWKDRLVPRIEYAEIAAYDLVTPYRARRLLDLSPQVGEDLFLKLHTHGTQEKNSKALLLDGGLDGLYTEIQREAVRRGMSYYFVTAWEMWRAVDAIRQKLDPVAQAAYAAPVLDSRILS